MVIFVSYLIAGFLTNLLVAFLLRNLIKKELNGRNGESFFGFMIFFGVVTGALWFLALPVIAIIYAIFYEEIRDIGLKNNNKEEN